LLFNNAILRWLSQKAIRHSGVDLRSDSEESPEKLTGDASLALLRNFTWCHREEGDSQNRMTKRSPI